MLFVSGTLAALMLTVFFHISAYLFFGAGLFAFDSSSFDDLTESGFFGFITGFIDLIFDFIQGIFFGCDSCEIPIPVLFFLNSINIYWLLRFIGFARGSGGE